MEVTQDMRQKAIDYKKNIAGKFMLVEGAKIKARISGEQFCVTRKIDGHLQCVFYRDGAAVMLNSQGKKRAGELKCLDIFAAFMGKKGVKSAIIAAELYVPHEIVRTYAPYDHWVQEHITEEDRPMVHAFFGDRDELFADHYIAHFLHHYPQEQCHRIPSGHHLSEEGAREIVGWIDKNPQFINAQNYL